MFGRLYTAIYVGSSNNLKKRFGEQLRNQELLNKVGSFVDGLDFWFCRLDVRQIEKIEQSLIDCLGPPANSIRGISARLKDPVPA